MQHKTFLFLVKAGGIVLAAGIVAVLLFAPTGQLRRRPDDLIIGTNAGYVPYVFRDQEGELVGFDIDVARAVARELGRRPVIVDKVFDVLLVAAKQGKVDMIIGGISITPLRQQRITMIPYHGLHESTYSLLFWGEPPAGVSDILTLLAHHERPVIATQVGTTMETYLEQFDGQLTRKLLTEIDEVLMNIRYKRSHAALLETPAAQVIAARSQRFTAVPVPLRRGDKTMGAGIGVNPRNKKLAKQVERAVKTLKQSGELQRLETYWFGVARAGSQKQNAEGKK